MMGNNIALFFYFLLLLIFLTIDRDVEKTETWTPIEFKQIVFLDPRDDTVLYSINHLEKERNDKTKEDRHNTYLMTLFDPPLKLSNGGYAYNTKQLKARGEQ
jgi:hypothetical protein